MAQITINEISSNYSYNIASSDYCTVALPITSCWGPGYFDPATTGLSDEQQLSATTWIHYPATQAGLEAFLSAYRGPASNYRAAKDYSYFIALSLLTSGYAVDICRVCPGGVASSTTTVKDTTDKTFTVKAKYPGTFGNNLKAVLTHKTSGSTKFQNLIIYVVDSAGAQTAVENLNFAFDLDNSTDAILHVTEIESNFVTFEVSGIESDVVEFTGEANDKLTIQLANGVDRPSYTSKTDALNKAVQYASIRYGYDSASGASVPKYIDLLQSLATGSVTDSQAYTYAYREWIYTAGYKVYELLTDKLSYSTNRIISPWDDQDMEEIGEPVLPFTQVSPLHAKMMEVAYNARCATALLDIPKSIDRDNVYSYAELLSTFIPATIVDDGLFQTHSALFAPWGQYTYTGTSRQNDAAPSFLALLIQRAMILNQSLQYEWAMPTTRKHNISVGKLAYTAPKSVLDKWQSREGAALNVITDIPDLGTSVWGNSTLMNVPAATYNALQNLSSRYLMNAVKNVAYKASLAITFQYNNDEAYSRFYAGVSPILDTMKNVGAIEKYEIKMAADINGLDSVNANSVIGTVKMWIFGVIDQITVDLIALPAGTDAH